MIAYNLGKDGHYFLRFRRTRYIASNMRLNLQGAGICASIAHHDMDGKLFRNRTLAALIAGLVAAMSDSTINGHAQETEALITCRNPVSGASWQIMIDYRKATVDSNPAKFRRTEISWFDPKDGGNYTLNLKSGDLTASVASSTGGYFRHGRCNVEKSQ